MIRNRSHLATSPARELALECLEAGIDAADPEYVFESSLSVRNGILHIDGTQYDLTRYARVLVVGGGKAAARQAMALERILDGYLDEGVVVTNEPTESALVDVLPGAHPVPSAEGVTSTERLLELVSGADQDTIVFVPISGGGSALMTAPIGEISLSDIQDLTTSLLDSGATIHEINAVRKHCSRIKGGGLTRAAAPATVVGLIMSDVVGDDLSVIASGPTVADETTYADAAAVLDRYGIEPAVAIQRHLDAGLEGRQEETPAPSDPIFKRVSNHLLADSGTAVRAAVEAVSGHPHEPLILSTRIRGEAREAAKTHVAIGEEILASHNPVAPPAVLLSGGETTVTVRGSGTGGPNQEFTLSAALELSSGLTLAAIDTDGIDGASEYAGGIVDQTTVDDQHRARQALDDNDASTLLARSGDIVETGPTGTNINDLRILVVDADY